MSVRVVARIRPLLKKENDRDVIVSSGPAGKEEHSSPTVVRIPNPKNEAELYSFQFNGIYDQEATQQDIFENEGTLREFNHGGRMLRANDSLAHSQASFQWL